MTYFYGELQGSKGEATRCGTKRSGVRACVRSWDRGIHVRISMRGIMGECIQFSIDRGSRGGYGKCEVVSLCQSDIDDLINGHKKLILVDSEESERIEIEKVLATPPDAPLKKKKFNPYDLEGE